MDVQLSDDLDSPTPIVFHDFTIQTRLVGHNTKQTVSIKDFSFQELQKVSFVSFIL